MSLKIKSNLNLKKDFESILNNLNYISDKACAKINLSFRVLGKSSNHYHSIESIVTFLPDIYDRVKIKKNKNLKVNITGEFSKHLAKKGGDTLVRNMILLFKKKYFISNNFQVIIEKNIPLGAGLGGGSADAAAIARLLIKMYNLKINKKEIINTLSKLGADIPACFFSYNQKVRGFGEKLTKLKSLNKTVWAIVIKPRAHFNTKDIFKKFSQPFSKKTYYNYNYKNLISDINSNENDLQEAAKSYSSLFARLIKNLPKNNSATIPRMTGSGSTIFILFNTKNSAEKYLSNIEKTTKGTWKRLSKVLL